MQGQGTYYNMEFINFESNKKTCGAGQFTFGPWPGNSDYVAYAEFINPVYDNVVEEALTFIPAPSQGWKNWEDCGLEFTCTGLYNVVTRLENIQSTGDSTLNLPRTFDVTSNNAESISVHAFKDNLCQFREAWNAWLCEDKFAVLIFDSLDDDRLDRSA